jgi:hypothetical protein
MFGDSPILQLIPCPQRHELHGDILPFFLKDLVTRRVWRCGYNWEGRSSARDKTDVYFACQLIRINKTSYAVVGTRNIWSFPKNARIYGILEEEIRFRVNMVDDWFLLGEKAGKCVR